jgi:TolA-binding protein
LAEAQTWRASAHNAAPERIDLWARKLDESPMALRAGPAFVLGSALCVQQPESAAIEFLKVPILHEHHRSLAAAALLAAGGCLQRAGQTAQAAALYRELAAGYGALPEVGEAQRRLQSLATEQRGP